MFHTNILGTGFLRWKLSLIDVILLAIALGIDCLVVSFSQGLIFDTNRTKTSLKLAVVMGLFQGGMPLIGYVGTDTLYRYIVAYGKWIVFGIFLILGLKFISEAFSEKKEEIKCLDFKCLIGLGVATSIDALVSGATLRLTETGFIIPCVIIGLTSFLMSIIGFWCGNGFKNLCPRCLEITGGVILIALAVKALV